ncbi:MAG TPA: 3-deoxy-7-phosphoheptulonate synthase [Acidobacteriota bacterium]|jgi:3-deoxy-7-phosphoheptulonate synthase
MLIAMDLHATQQDVDRVVAKIRAMGFEAHCMPGAQRTAIGITGNPGPLDPKIFEMLPGVRQAIPVSKPFKLVSREIKEDDTVVKIGGVPIGGGHFTVIAGPCAVETRQQLLATARLVKQHGANILRGGAFKPRTSPYSFQGLGEEGLKLLVEAREETGLPFVTEAMNERSLELVARQADAVQIGARNMQNFSLLKEAGQCGRPVVLKRGMSATMEEWLMSAEYLMSEGNYQVVLCERGVRTFSDHSRFTLDLSVIPAIRELSHLPVIVDPSHGAGDRKKVVPLARAGAAVGADGIMVEVHPNPLEALCDGPQALLPAQFEEMVGSINALAGLLGKKRP